MGLQLSKDQGLKEIRVIARIDEYDCSSVRLLIETIFEIHVYTLLTTRLHFTKAGWTWHATIYNQLTILRKVIDLSSLMFNS